MPGSAVENLILQLKKDFYAKLGFIHSNDFAESDPTLSLLTDEEIKVIESAWVELAIWKQKQSR
ncbi:hypothetical protein KP803_00830 [Vibrio sp. ZSDE26]|uniref:3-demethylubiquinone-9 3-methyltransferase n=1 Tax=Vibrio amylolyticus TaxID=2847292 RepID=A0A9X1XF15_9VIBR|nr:hypothetical protein [Vibrio amylolyticus]MCK6261812.1 hypothetical protein [Vibrio amylolyticus]